MVLGQLACLDHPTERCIGKLLIALTNSAQAVLPVRVLLKV